MNQIKPTDDPLYERAKQILATNPGIGKNRLGLSKLIQAKNELIVAKTAG